MHGELDLAIDKLLAQEPGALIEQELNNIDFGEFRVENIDWTQIGPQMLRAYGSAGYAARDFAVAGMPKIDPDNDEAYEATFVVATRELNRRLKLAGLLPPDYDEPVLP